MPKREMGLIDMRCTACGKLLAKIELIEGTIERKCPCGTLNSISTKKPESKDSVKVSSGPNAYQERISGKVNK